VLHITVMAYKILLKTLSWRVIGTTSTFAISYVVTGAIGLSSTIAVVQMIVNTVLYYIHEHVWSQVD
jgi:uncharacterized membrane protein